MKKLDMLHSIAPILSEYGTGDQLRFINQLIKDTSTEENVNNTFSTIDLIDGTADNLQDGIKFKPEEVFKGLNDITLLIQKKYNKSIIKHKGTDKIQVNPVVWLDEITKNEKLTCQLGIFGALFMQSLPLPVINHCLYLRDKDEENENDD